MDATPTPPSRTSRGLLAGSVAGQSGAAWREGLIVMRLRTIEQLFDPVDPSPFGEQDLTQWAADYIVESVKELGARPRELHFVVTRAEDASQDATVAAAVQSYFARQAMLRGRALRRLLRHGLIMLGIGVAFLVAFFNVAQSIASLLPEGSVSSLLREGSLIVGWVAMWRPIEIFLYDWWPIEGQRRMHQGLSRIVVRVLALQAADAARTT